VAEPNSPTRSGQRRRRAVSLDLGLRDLAIDPPVHATQRLLCSTEQASMFLRQFEVVTPYGQNIDLGLDPQTFRLPTILSSAGNGTFSIN
jgi:hypothetical protein